MNAFNDCDLRVLSILAVMESETSRCKNANFTRGELAVLVEECRKKKDVLESSFKDVGANSKKKTAWKSVTEKVNAVGGHNRNEKQIRKKWADMKSQAKRKTLEVKKERVKTGGGVAKEITISPIEEIVIESMGRTAVHGIEGGVDTSGKMSF